MFILAARRLGFGGRLGIAGSLGADRRVYLMTGMLIIEGSLRGRFLLDSGDASVSLGAGVGGRVRINEARSSMRQRRAGAVGLVSAARPKSRAGRGLVVTGMPGKGFARTVKSAGFDRGLDCG
uniref:Uncharacterized protein n=1 Tax=Phenylobacterium glaciei TaxID=2803784 RepID=A0A974P7F1_9CAUL|nr:hypothetical protein JKL49_08275 [Phenylobacterium glaciei]